VSKIVDLKIKISGVLSHLVEIKSRLKFFESKKIKISVLVFCTIIAFLLSIPITFNNSALKFKIEQELSAALSTNFSIKDDVEIQLIPSPAINLSNSLLQNYGSDNKVYNIYSYHTKIKLSFLEMLQGNFVIKEMIFSNAIIERYYVANQPNNPENKLRSKIAQIINEAEKGNIKKAEEGFSYNFFLGSKIKAANLKPSNLSENNITIALENSSLILYDKSARKKIIDDVNFKVTFKENSITSSGYFSDDKVINEFSLSAYFDSSSKWRKSVFKLNSPFVNLKIKGNFTSKNKGLFHSDFNGELTAEISELQPFYKGYISNNKNIYNKIKSGVNPIKISSSVTSKEGEFLFNNLILNSSLIGGKGDLSINLTEKFTAIDVHLDLNNLDLDKILSSEKIDTGDNNLFTRTYQNSDESTETLEQNLPKEENEEGKKEEKQGNRKSNLNVVKPIKDFDVAAEIKIKSTKYMNGEVKNIDLYATISNNGEIMFLPIVFEIPGEGKLRTNGILFQENDLPKFIGKFDIQGNKLKDIFQWLGIESQNLKFDNLKNYMVYSDIFLAPNNILLNNFYLNLNSDESELLGEIKIDTSSKTTYINNSFHISKFNIDDYFLVSGQNVYLSPGSLLKKLLWLNEISTNNNFDLTFDKITYKGENFTNQSVKLIFGQGYFEIKDLHLESEKTDLMANLIVDIRDRNPKFDMSISANSFYYKYNNSNLQDEAAHKNNFADQFFALPSLEDFNGSVSLKFNTLSLDGIEIGNAKLTGKIDNGNIAISELNCEIYNGILSYKGNIGIGNNKVFNGNLSLNNVSLEKLLPDLVGVNNIYGIANISASILASANKKSEFTSNFVSTANFSSNSAVLGYGLSDIVQKTFYKQYYKDDLQDPEKILFNPKSSTLFTEASGTIKANKNKDNSFKINLKATAANGILSGKFDLDQNSIDSTLNIIFLTGNAQKQIPINIATSIKGEFGNIMTSSNLDQLKQYIGISGNYIKSNNNTNTPQTQNTKVTTPVNQIINNTSNQNNNSDILSSELSKIKDQKTAEELKSAMTDPEAYIEQKRKEAELNKNNQQ